MNGQMDQRQDRGPHPSKRCYACFLTRMEVLYRVWKDENERAGRLAYEQLKALPLNWVEPLAEFNVALPRRDPADRNGSKRSGPPPWPPHRAWRAPGVPRSGGP